MSSHSYVALPDLNSSVILTLRIMQGQNPQSLPLALKPVRRYRR
jgi:hypothetical protein